MRYFEVPLYEKPDGVLATRNDQNTTYFCLYKMMPTTLNALLLSTIEYRSLGPDTFADFVFGNVVLVPLL